MQHFGEEIKREREKERGLYQRNKGTRFCNNGKEMSLCSQFFHYMDELLDVVIFFNYPTFVYY